MNREHQRGITSEEAVIWRWVRSQEKDNWRYCGTRCNGHCPPKWLGQWMAEHGGKGEAWSNHDKDSGKGGEQGKGGFGEKDNKRKADFDEDKKDDGKGSSGDKGNSKGGFDGNGKVSEQVQSSSSSSSSRQIPPWRRDQPREDPAEPVVETPATKEARIAHLEFLKPFVERLLYWHKHGGLEPHYPPEWSQQSVADAHVVCTHLLRKLGIADRHL